MSDVALVTDATGFFGRHLVTALRTGGYSVVAWVRRAASVEFPPDVRIDWWPDDNRLAEAVAGLGVPIVFHLAAAGISDRSQRNAATQFQVNVGLTAKLVHAAVEARARGFVYVGSCAEYGVVPVGELVSENAPLTACDLYGASKAAAGLWAQAVATHGSLGFVWARVFGLYGPGEQVPRLLPTVYAALRDGRGVDLTPGQQVRDWLFVTDAAEGLVQLGSFAAEGRRGIYNLCTGKGRSTRDIVTMIAASMRADSDLLHFGAIPGRPDEPDWLVGDPRAAKELGWSAHTDINAGIAITLEELRRSDENKL